MKISEFIKEKLENFSIFINEQLEKVNIPNDSKINLVNNLTKYKQDINAFIHAIITLSGYTIDNAIKLFLLNYNINIDDIKDFIDYDKLKRYLEMFTDLVKNNIN